MEDSIIHFESDYMEGCHPKILEKIAQINFQKQVGYGQDDFCQSAKQKIKDSPIILLDDVLSELDRKRQKQLLDSIEGMQTILTCTGLEEFVDRQKDENKLFYVEDGKVTVKN